MVTIAEIRSAAPSPEHRHLCGISDRVAVQRDHAEGVPGQGQAAGFGGAAVEDMQQHPLTGLDANRIAVAEHPAVDGEPRVTDLVAHVGATGERGRHRRFALCFEVGVLLTGQEVTGHVSSPAESGLKFLERQEDSWS